eukprot:TRINITY_DN5807_c2_g2_i3.p1 TRINITY_DN5807_c2_g2~~TRINITY_DN5807_c2_g2_i3.p1  ORF type:complete len:448 (+),score=74.82 TRINITY_DN5807_c2_g2_i3:77-1345(+)
MRSVACGGQRSARASCRAGRRGEAQCGGAADADAVNTCLLGTVTGQGQGAAQPASPKSPRRGRGTVLHGLRDALSRLLAKFSKKPVTSDSTQTESSEDQPQLLIQEHSLMLATKRTFLSAQQSSCSQPELKQGVIDCKALQIAQLQSELAALQAQLELSARNEAAARQNALGAGLRLWHDEEKGRADVLLQMKTEWQDNMFTLHAPSCDEVTADPTHTQHTYADAPHPRTDSMESLLPEPTSSRSPTYARECLFIDKICHWVGSFVYRDWARVCSTTARGVQRALLETYGVWSTAADMLGKYQSSGRRLSGDNHYFGSVPGPIVAARDEVRALHDKVVRCQCTQRWQGRFVLHLLITANMYEEMRLLHRRVFMTAANMTTDLHRTLLTLEQTLGSYDSRAAAAESSQEGAPPDHSDSAGAES